MAAPFSENFSRIGFGNRHLISCLKQKKGLFRGRTLDFWVVELELLKIWFSERISDSIVVVAAAAPFAPVSD